MFWLMDSMPYATTLNLNSPHKKALSNPHLDYSSRVNPMPSPLNFGLIDPKNCLNQLWSYHAHTIQL